MEIKTTEKIVKESAITDFKATFVWKNVDIYKKWIAFDDLIEFIKNFNDDTAFNKWQIRKNVLIEKLRDLKKRGRK